MIEWKYDGYTKVYSDDRRHMIETWIWKCPICGYTIRKPSGNINKPHTDCPSCEESKCEYEAAVDMAQYCERYEPTYNPEDGSM